MSANDTTIKIFVTLTGATKEKYENIKKRKGLVNDTDMVRLIINEYSETLQKEA